MRVFLFLFGMVGIFICVQEILDLDYYGLKTCESGDVMNEFYELTEKNDIQAVIIGASGVGYAIDPMKIYKDTGIVSFNFSTGGQSSPVSYYLCEEIFKTQHPKVVIMDVSSSFESEFWSGGYRYILDTIHFGKAKLGLASYYADHQSNRWISSFISAMLPIYQYHERWTSLSKDDFILKRKDNEYRKGYTICNIVIGSHLSIEQMNSFAEQEYWTVNMTNGIFDKKKEDGIYDPKINEENWKYILKIKQLCDENGSELLLIKTPAFGHPLTYDGAWTLRKSNIIKALAASEKIDFVDLQYDVDLALDWKTDPGAGTQHLNYLGAQKVTSYLEGQLKDKYGITGYTCKAYEDDIPIYDRVCQLCDLSLSTDMYQYFDKVSKWGDTTLLFSVSGDMTGGLSDEICQFLGSLGFQTNFRDMKFSDSYVAVMENGNISYEAYSNHKLTYNDKTKKGIKYSIVSSGWYPGSNAEIKIDNVKYSTNGGGLNIVVLDNDSGIVIDSVSFNLGSTSKPTVAVHNNDFRLDVLVEYQQYLMN